MMRKKKTPVSPVVTTSAKKLSELIEQAVRPMQDELMRRLEAYARRTQQADLRIQELFIRVNHLERRLKAIGVAALQEREGC